MDASVDTMGSNDPAPYVDNWFDGKTIRNARKILVRWTEKKEAVANNMKFCGNMYSHTLNSGDILLFDTCRLKHRSSKPKPTDSDTQPYRVNVAMTGLANFLTFDAVSSTSEDELEQEPKKKRSTKG